MANYAKQFLEELKVTVEAYLNALTTDKNLIEKLMTPFTLSADPKPEDVDQVISEHAELLQTQMLQVLSNKDTPHDTRLTQVKLFAEVSFNLPSLMKKEKSDFLENQFKALEQRALEVGIDQSEIDSLKMSILNSQNDFGVFQTAMDTLEGLVNSKQAVINPDINAAIVPVPSAPEAQASKVVHQYVAPTLDAKATTAKEKLLALISNGALNDASQNKKLYELAAKLDSGVSNLSAEEAKQLTVAIVQVKNALGDLSESNQEIIQAVSALAQLQLAMSKRYLQAESALIESKNPDGKMTAQTFIQLMKDAGDAGKVKFDKMDGNVAVFAENSENIKYEIKVTADPKNPNNFVITGTDIQKVADLARGIHAVNKDIPLTLKMGNDPEKAFELLGLLTKAEKEGDEVKINVTPEQRATFEKTFAKDPAKLASLKEILSTQDRLAAQSPEPEAHSAPKGP